jgi:hypothetical protein
VGAALRFAAGAPDGDSVACVTGALLGAAHGVEALPLDLISRHELAWVLDALARDLVAQLTDSSSDSEYAMGWDPRRGARYPRLVSHRLRGEWGQGACGRRSGRLRSPVHEGR